MSLTIFDRGDHWRLLINQECWLLKSFNNLKEVIDDLFKYFGYVYVEFQQVGSIFIKIHNRTVISKSFDIRFSDMRNEDEIR